MPFLARRWLICGLLLLATAINYMDRQSMSNASKRITTEMSLNEEQYGHLETGFGLAMAVGSVLLGFLAEKTGVRFLYPCVLAAWSFAAIASAWSTSFSQLLLCRIAFGFFEGGHWPCALKTSFAVLDDNERTLGNSILQSGASVASILTPQVMKVLMTDDISSWRYAFQVVGAAGLLWVVVWLLFMRESDFASKETPAQRDEKELLGPILCSSRFWAIAILILGAQTCWHLFRVWLPKFLQQGRGYDETAMLNFTSFYYIATDVGCLAAGALSLWLVRRFNMSAHQSKRRVYQLCAALTCCALAIPWLTKGNMLLAVILVVGAGALGLFPCYYSFVQELSTKSVAKLTGILNLWVWGITSPMHSAFGKLVDQTKSFDLGMTCAGLAPLLGVVSLALLWRPAKSGQTRTA